MRKPWLDRLRDWLCARFGHKPSTDPWGVTVCRRCNLLISGRPLGEPR
jgi:hypothetical protein